MFSLLLSSATAVAWIVGKLRLLKLLGKNVLRSIFTVSEGYVTVLSSVNRLQSEAPFRKVEALALGENPYDLFKSFAFVRCYAMRIYGTLSASHHVNIEVKINSMDVIIFPFPTRENGFWIALQYISIAANY
jgi:hypothetical protein